MAYTKTIWENSPSENTPLSAENLNNIENGIDDVDTRLTTAETDINGLDTRLTTAEGEIDTAQSDINNAEAVIGNETDTYSASSTYALGSLVIYNSLLYKCTTAITVAEAWTIAHWTQVSLTSLANDGDVYSTSEQIVGKWIDGKPIYRTSINVSNITTYNNYVSTGVTISNIDNVIDIKSAAKRVPDASQPNNETWYITGGLTEKTVSADYVTAVRIANGGVQYLVNASSYRIVGMNITIEYTKTTD